MNSTSDISDRVVDDAGLAGSHFGHLASAGSCSDLLASQGAIESELSLNFRPATRRIPLRIESVDCDLKIAFDGIRWQSIDSNRLQTANANR